MTGRAAPAPVVPFTSPLREALIDASIGEITNLANGLEYAGRNAQFDIGEDGRLRSAPARAFAAQALEAAARIEALASRMRMLVDDPGYEHEFTDEIVGLLRERRGGYVDELREFEFEPGDSCRSPDEGGARHQRVREIVAAIDALWCTSELSSEVQCSQET